MGARGGRLQIIEFFELEGPWLRSHEGKKQKTLAIWHNITDRFLFEARGKACINVTSVKGRERGAYLFLPEGQYSDPLFEQVAVSVLGQYVVILC